jgi:hypothetical protein
MTKIKPLHVEFRLETWDKKYHILAAKDVLCLSILLTAMDRNGTDWN